MSERKILKILHEEFARRKKSNHRYSLRSYARSLGIAPSLLSRILRGKVSLTPSMFNRLSHHLGLKEEECHILMQDLKAYQQAKKNGFSDCHFKKLSLSDLKILKDWYYNPILEYLSEIDPGASSYSISHVLDIPEKTVHEAINNLINLGFIVKDRGNLKVINKRRSSFSCNKSTSPTREQQKQLLKKANKAIETVEISRRFQHSYTMALDSDLIPEVKKRIKNFNRSLALLIERKGHKKDQVYEIVTSFFPYTNTKDESN